MTGQLHATTALHSGAAPSTRWIGGWLGSRCRSAPYSEETNRFKWIDV